MSIPGNSSNVFGSFNRMELIRNNYLESADMADLLTGEENTATANEIRRFPQHPNNILEDDDEEDQDDIGDQGDEDDRLLHINNNNNSDQGDHLSISQTGEMQSPSKKIARQLKRQQLTQRSLLRQPTLFKKDTSKYQASVAAAEQLQQDRVDQQAQSIKQIPRQDVNLKYGDIIYFKFYNELSKGIISGDGIAGNKLECISIGKVIISGSEEWMKIMQSDAAYSDDDDDEDGYDDDDNNQAKKANETQNGKPILFKRASLSFRKSLFRVMNAKKYYYKSLQKEEVSLPGTRTKSHTQKLQDLEQKVREEAEENQREFEQKIGTNVIYGQEIQLEHMYSKCFVTLNPEVLAYEHCCRELSLEEESSQWSNFIINSANNAKKTGEPVLYTEQLCFYSSENPYYWINISQGQYRRIHNTVHKEGQQQNYSQEALYQQSHLFDEGLEVNCTDRQVPLKLCSYISTAEAERRQSAAFQQLEQVQPGDIVYIYNRLVKGRLGVARKNTGNGASEDATQFSMKDVEIELEQSEDLHTKRRLPVRVMRVENYTKNVSQQYEFFVDEDEDEKRIETLWEIQRLKNFNSDLIHFEESVRIKNVWTGLYLNIGLNNSLNLSLEGNLDKSFFLLRPKKSVKAVELILQHSTPIRICQFMQNSNVLFVRCKENLLEKDEFKFKGDDDDSDDEKQKSKGGRSKFEASKSIANRLDHVLADDGDDNDQDDNDAQNAVSKIQSIYGQNIKKDKRGEIEFELNPSDPKLQLLADRVSSLFPYLMNFYVFLQSWGNRVERVGSKEVWKYEYSVAFNNQKNLYNQVQQLFQSLENLADFLQEDGSIKQRQKILLDAGIVEILLLILKLIHLKIYCHCELEIQARGESTQQQLRNYEVKNIPDKSAQKIASIKLAKSIPVLYNLLEQCIRGNSDCASFVLRSQEDNFLFEQIKFHKQEVVQLLKEATRYVGNDQVNQNMLNMKKWIDKITQISLANIAEQTFIIELLSLSITDHLEQPIPEYQNVCRKLLFQQPKSNSRDNDEEIERHLQSDQYEFAEDRYSAQEKIHLGYLRKPQLISFKTVQDIPYIIFNLDRSTRKRFQNDNPDLFYLGKKGMGTSEHETSHFPLDHVNGQTIRSKNAPPTNSLEIYEIYVLEVLNLYALLSAGRNQKSIKCLQSIGLTKEYIYNCLSSKRLDNNHLRQYRSILNLYDSFILNVLPFSPISQFNNLCFLGNDLDRFDSNKDPSYQLFRDIVINSESKQAIREEFTRIVEKNAAQNQTGNNLNPSEMSETKLLLSYAQLIVNKEKADLEEAKATSTVNNINEVISSLQLQNDLTIANSEKDNIISRLDHNTPALLSKPDINKSKLSVFMMETFHQMLKVIKTRIDLGYNTPQENARIIAIIPNLFFALIDYKEEASIDVLDPVRLKKFKKSLVKRIRMRNYANYNQNWIYDFMLYNLKYSFDNLITTKIFIEAIQILNIVTKLNMYLQIVKRIQEYRKNAGKNRTESTLPLDYFKSFQFHPEDDDPAMHGKTSRSQRTINISVLVLQAMKYLRRDQILEGTMQKTLLTSFEYLRNLQLQIGEVEIIEDQQELELYCEINGISDSQNFRSPQDIKMLVMKTIQYFEFTKKLVDDSFFTPEYEAEVRKHEKTMQEYESNFMKFLDLEKYYEHLTQAIDQCNLLFHQKRTNSRDTDIRSRRKYIAQLQSILRHSKIPEYLLQLLENVPQYNSMYIEFYRRIVIFFEFYTKDNIDNKQRLFPIMEVLMTLGLIPNKEFPLAHLQLKNTSHIQPVEIQPIKISRLCIEILEESKLNHSFMKDTITKIITLIEDNLPFNVDKDMLKQPNWRSIQYKIYRFGVHPLRCLAVIQYFKILKSLTISSNGKSMQHNQLMILNNFMHKRTLSDIIQPIIESYLTKFKINFSSEVEYLKLRLHTQGIMLLSACCKDYKLGIQEVQRFIMFDTLKAIVVSQKAPFVLKRAYLKCMFEAYVNRVYDLDKDGSNEVISNIELNDILTSEMIPILKLTTSYKYLEGLIRNKEHSNELEGLNSLRQNVKWKKFTQFKGNPAYDQAIWADEQAKKHEREGVPATYAGVIKDCSEYWKYLFKEGVIHFVLDTYDEFNDISSSTQEAETHSAVVGNFKIIGHSMQQLYEQLEIADKEFKIQLPDSYVNMELLQAILEVIPIGNPKVTGKNISINMDQNSKAYITLMKKNQMDNNSSSNNNNQFEQKLAKESNSKEDQVETEEKEVQKLFKLQLLRKRITSRDFIMYFLEQHSHLKNVNRSLFESLNSQKICYTPMQISNLRMYLAPSRNSFAVAQNQQLQLTRRQSSYLYSQEKQELLSIITGILHLSSQSARRSDLNSQFADQSQEILLSFKQTKYPLLEQQAVQKLRSNFQRSIKKQMKRSLNILKKSILDERVYDSMVKKVDPKEESHQYDNDIDQGIADYESIHLKSEGDENDKQKLTFAANQDDADEIIEKEENVSDKASEQSSKEMFNNNTIKNNGDAAAEGEESDTQQMQSSSAVIERTYLERMMIDSQITLFLRDLQSELDYYGQDSLEEEDDDDDEETGIDNDDESGSGDYEEQKRKRRLRLRKIMHEAANDVDEGYFDQAVEVNQSQVKFAGLIDDLSFVFSSQKYYLVKVVRLILEIVQVTDETMEDLTSTDDYDKHEAKRKVDLMQMCQTVVAEKEIFAHALKFIKVDASYDLVQEGLTFLICMLNRGCQEAQNAVLHYFQKNQDAMVDFISFLRNFFNQEISHQINVMSEQQAVTEVPTEFEILSLKILKLIQLFCENVNSDFQIFLMKQSDEEGSLLPDYNITLEVSTFLSIFLEDDNLPMFRKQNIIMQCIETLNECITGQQVVLKCIARNRRLFTYLNEKIIRQRKIDFQAPRCRAGSINDQQNQRNMKKNLELFYSALKFMLTIVSGIPNREELEYLLEQIKTQKLIAIMKQIYDMRISPKKEQILMDEDCEHMEEEEGHKLCDEDFCYEGHVTDIDKLIISIGFNIFILFYYLRDIFPENRDKLMVFFFDEERDLASSFDVKTDKKAERKQFEKILNKDDEEVQRQKTMESKKYYANTGNVEQYQSFDPFNEQDVQQHIAKTASIANQKDPLITKLSARKLLSRGMTHVVLKDMATLDHGRSTVDHPRSAIRKAIEDEIQQMEEKNNIDSYFNKNEGYFRFFKDFVGAAEVVKQDDTLTKVYFQKPFYTKFLTFDIKKHLIYKADRDSNTERLLFLLCHAQFYEEQMIHKQRTSKWGIFSYVADKWRLYKQISYYLVIALTIITLATYGSSGSDSNSSDVVDDSSEGVKNTFEIVSIIQLVLSFSILVSCAIERYPISIHRNVSSQRYELIQGPKENAGFPEPEYLQIYNRIANDLYQFFSPENAKANKYIAFGLILYDFENIYNLAYLIITAFAFNNNLIYCFLLLDIVKRSEDLQNVISSITTNAFNLIKFAFLGVIIMYIYGIIGFYQFKDDYDDGSGGVSNTFVLAIASTIKMGLLNGGGIADSLVEVDDPFSDRLWARYFFDLSFFIIINMLFIQIIFGIILDTFGELRDNRSELLDMVVDTCYICGLQRKFVEAKSSEDWHHHIYLEHNCYNLLFYVIYLNRKSENDCNALEKYIKRLLETKDQKRVKFIPMNRSMYIEAQTAKLDEDQANEKDESNLAA